MNEYAIVELENKNKFVILDSFKYEGKKYFLLVDIHGEDLGEEVRVCIYNEKMNYFEKIDDEDEYNFVADVFNNKLEKQSAIYSELQNIDFKKMVKLIVVSSDGFNYEFKDEHGNKVQKNIDFYVQNKPKVGDSIYMTKNVVKEINIFQYGQINYFNKINDDEIIKVVNEKSEYFLQRYYG